MLTFAMKRKHVLGDINADEDMGGIEVPRWEVRLSSTRRRKVKSVVLRDTAGTSGREAL
jgi:hypothetical protein